MMVISLAYKYIFILARTIEESYLALRSRLYDNIRNKNLRSIVGGRILFIYNRSHAMYDGTYKAMVSRGYQGKLQFYARHQFTLIDLITAVIIASMGVIIILI
jgi:energy-coupling factor transporter transmembrane protein EcfT